MPPPPRQLALGLVVSLSLLLTVDAAARGAEPRAASGIDARVTATFVMRGQIVTAVRVSGEHRGQTVTRQWTLAGLSCRASVCQRLSLRRERSAHRFDRLVLTRIGRGRYAGRSRFYAALGCRGRTYPRGELVPYRITVTVTHAVAIEGIGFASNLTATYTNLTRTDRTPCPIGPSHDAARYTGLASPLPSPPAATFSVALSPATDSAGFTDTSARGAGGAQIVSRTWQFGDPGSGSANTADTAQASHNFTAPGTYDVSLTVIDGNGLTSTQTQAVVAPGPPTAAWSARRNGASLTYAFVDQSARGIGDAPIVTWIWNFGDSQSGNADSSGAPDPQHSFTGPGTYHVCLVVVDANQRESNRCADLLVPASPAPAPAQRRGTRLRR
jgi:PKD repeat protein